MLKLFKPLLITGMKHSGKTTTGKTLSRMTGIRFLDIDDLIEELYFEKTGNRKTFREIYREAPENFKKHEAGAAEVLVNRKQILIAAAGGGLCANEDAVKILKDEFVFICINEKKEVLLQRILAGGIPAFLDPDNPEEHFSRLYDERTAIYHSLCRISIEAEERHPEDIAEDIIESLKEHGYAR